MQNIITIKLFKSEMLSDAFHDIKLDEFDKVKGNLKEYGNLNNLKIFFTVCQPQMLLQDEDCYAEVFYTQELSSATKKFIIDTINQFCIDADFDIDSLEEFPVPCTILFGKILLDDVVEI